MLFQAILGRFTQGLVCSVFGPVAMAVSVVLTTSVVRQWLRNSGVGSCWRWIWCQHLAVAYLHVAGSISQQSLAWTPECEVSVAEGVQSTGSKKPHQTSKTWLRSIPGSGLLL